MWQKILFSFVFQLIASVLAPKPPGPKPSKLQDLNVPVAKTGTEIGVAYGCPWIRSPKVVWYGDLRTKKIKSKGGKK